MKLTFHTHVGIPSTHYLFNDRNCVIVNLHRKLMRPYSNPHLHRCEYTLHFSMGITISFCQICSIISNSCSLVVLGDTSPICSATKSLSLAWFAEACMHQGYWSCLVSQYMMVLVLFVFYAMSKPVWLSSELQQTRLCRHALSDNIHGGADDFSQIVGARLFGYEVR